jgi:hypothetical protein
VGNLPPPPPPVEPARETSLFVIEPHEFGWSSTDPDTHETVVISDIYVFAEQASKHRRWVRLPEGYVLRGVRWVAVVDGGTRVVAATLEADDHELAFLRHGTDQHDAVCYYKEGKPVPVAHNGLP